MSERPYPDKKFVRNDEVFLVQTNSGNIEVSPGTEQLIQNRRLGVFILKYFNEGEGVMQNLYVSETAFDNFRDLGIGINPREPVDKDDEPEWLTDTEYRGWVDKVASRPDNLDDLFDMPSFGGDNIDIDWLPDFNLDEDGE